jgi:hypothetical protein
VDEKLRYQFDQREIESMDDKKKISPDMLITLLTINTPRDITQDISSNNNGKPITLERVSDSIVELFY